MRIIHSLKINLADLEKKSAEVSCPHTKANKLMLIPITLKEANEFITKFHRHHKAGTGHKFSIGVSKNGSLCGVAIVSRPVSRVLQAQQIAEVTRLCTDGTKNACSILYAACAQAAKAMGFCQIVTYILHTEPGTSLKASGWICDGQVRKDGKGWTNRPDRLALNQGAKIRWRKSFHG